jgi:hypothetical protein
MINTASPLIYALSETCNGFLVEGSYELEGVLQAFIYRAFPPAQSRSPMADTDQSSVSWQSSRRCRVILPRDVGLTALIMLSALDQIESTAG